MKCTNCKRNVNQPSKAELKYEICSFCGSKTFPNKYEVKKGVEVEIKVENGFNKGRMIKGKLETIETVGDWHYEGLMVILDNGERGRLKKIITEKDETKRNYQRSGKKKELVEEALKIKEEIEALKKKKEAERLAKDETKNIQFQVKKSKNEQSTTCKGICQKFKVKKISGKGRYESGQAHCQVCDTWLDHKGCHLKNGSNAKEETVGWFCNCCNYRVRQIPRNKKYKDQFRSKKIDLSDNNYEELIQPEDIQVSKGQAHLLKNLIEYMPDFNGNMSSDNVIEQIPQTLQHQIEDNWGNINHFLKLATDYFSVNKISGIILFEKLHNKLEYVPKKEEFFYNFPVDENWIKNEFQSWEHFLELLNYDPWYRDKKREFKKTKEIEKESEIIEDVSEIEIDEDELQNIRETLKAHFKKLDLEQTQWEFTHENMFELLETYLKLLPNKKKYSEIMNFL